MLKGHSNNYKYVLPELYFIYNPEFNSLQTHVINYKKY